MRFSPTSVSLISGLTLLSTASARIIGLEAPRTIAAGESFTVSLLTGIYIQPIHDVAAAFGLASGPSNPRQPDSLGVLIGSFYLGLDSSNNRYKLNFTVSTDEKTLGGPATLSASVFSLYGASHSPIVAPFNVTVTVGDTTSSDKVRATLYGP